jgi:hypothetical protein
MIVNGVLRLFAGIVFRQVVVSGGGAIPAGAALVVATDADVTLVGGLAIGHAGPTLGILTLSELAALRPANRPTWSVPCVPVIALGGWRPRLLVLLSAPIRSSAFDQDQLVEVVEDAMETVGLEPAVWSDLLCLAEVRRLYVPRGRSPAEREAALFQFERAWQKIRGEPDVREMSLGVASLIERRLAMGLRDSELGSLERPAAFGKLARLIGLFTTLWLSLPGIVVHAPVGWAAMLWLGPRKSSWRAFLGAFLAPLGFLGVIAVGGALGRVAGLAIALVLWVASGVAVAALHRRCVTLSALFRAVGRDRTPAQAARDLWADRLALSEVVQTVVDRPRESYLVSFPSQMFRLR